MKNKSVLILLFLICSISNKILAQDGMDKPFFDASNSKIVNQEYVQEGPLPPPAEPVPIDDFIPILVIVGFAIGYRKLLNKKTYN